MKKYRQIFEFETGVFEDWEGFKYKKVDPLTTIEVSVVNPKSSKLNTKLDFIRKAEKFPSANAFLDRGVIRTDQEGDESDEIRQAYYVHKIELYHIGE